VSRYIAAPDFPCVGAKSALNKNRLRLGDYASLGQADDVPALCDDLRKFSNEFPDPGGSPVSFIAMFREGVADEAAFETKLWAHLQAMHDHDRSSHPWNESVSSDPSRSDFSMSIAGRAFFVVGLHPGASRLSRQAPFPCLVFNFHDQFEHLKASGKYQSMQTAIRARDVELQGSVNPVLARFGEASEARQYSGRAAGAEWRCPFHAGGER
jgi:FPC/CPF motif-containing protein YcgG